MAYNSGYWEELEGSLRKQLAEARAENAALVAELQRMADEPPTLEEIAADLDKIEMLEKELTEARAEIEKYKMGKISPADYYSMAEAEEKLCKELAEARAEVEHWKGECSDLVRMAHEMRAEIDYFQTLIDLQHKRTVEANKLWQKAHNKPNVWPDLGKLVEWLMNERKYALMERDDKRREIEADKWRKESLAKDAAGLNLQAASDSIKYWTKQSFDKDKLIEQMREALKLALAECRSTHCENEIKAALSAADGGK